MTQLTLRAAARKVSWGSFDLQNDELVIGSTDG